MQLPSPCLPSLHEPKPLHGLAAPPVHGLLHKAPQYPAGQLLHATIPMVSHANPQTPLLQVQLPLTQVPRPLQITPSAVVGHAAMQEAPLQPV